MPKLITKQGKGRPKQPLEKRKVLTDYPHHNRKGPPDLPLGETLGIDPLPETPPFKLDRYELQAWKQITDPQRALGKKAWLFATDTAYIVQTCVVHGKIMRVRAKLAEMAKDGTDVITDEGKANPLINVLANLTSKYAASLSALGMAPTKRQLVADDEPPPEEPDDAPFMV